MCVCVCVCVCVLRGVTPGRYVSLSHWRLSGGGCLQSGQMAAFVMAHWTNGALTGASQWKRCARLSINISPPPPHTPAHIAPPSCPPPHIPHHIAPPSCTRERNKASKAHLPKAFFCHIINASACTKEPASKQSGGSTVNHHKHQWPAATAP